MITYIANYTDAIFVVPRAVKNWQKLLGLTWRQLEREDRLIIGKIQSINLLLRIILERNNIIELLVISKSEKDMNLNQTLKAIVIGFCSVSV